MSLSQAARPPTANRRLGQNFLSDVNMARALCAAIEPNIDDIVVEFCAGTGALTRGLLGQVAQIHAVEIDDRMIAYLEQLAQTSAKDCPTKLNIIHDDALKIDVARLGPQTRILGNLAYNISVPLLLRLVRQSSSIRDIHLMLQKEVAMRVCAQPGTSDYGRLTVMVQTWFDASILRRVPPQCFSPRPRVDSCFVRLRTRQPSRLAVHQYPRYEKFIRAAFAMRRKSLANNLRTKYHDGKISVLARHGLAPLARAQEITIEDFVELFADVDGHGI